MAAERLNNEDAYKEAKTVKFIAEDIADKRNVTMPASKDYDRAHEILEYKRFEDSKETKRQIDLIDEQVEMTHDIHAEKSKIIPEMKELMGEAASLTKEVLDRQAPDISEEFSADLFEIVDGEVVERIESEPEAKDWHDFATQLQERYGLDIIGESGYRMVYDTTSFARRGKAYLAYARIKRDYNEYYSQLEQVKKLPDMDEEDVRTGKILDFIHTMCHEYIHLASKPVEIKDKSDRKKLARIALNKLRLEIVRGFSRKTGKYKKNKEVGEFVDSYFNNLLFQEDGEISDDFMVYILGGRVQVTDKNENILLTTGYELNEELTELINERLYREVCEKMPNHNETENEYYMSLLRERRSRHVDTVSGKSSKSQEDVINPEEAEKLLKDLSKKTGIDYTVGGDNLVRAFTSGELVIEILRNGFTEYIR
ncbi:MAG: hypothetical protein PHW75_03170 [Patescibacteria group bacterium]|nr:hypothetical protein [Patescibacteria group bacterium]